jgi:hypothetical protein
LHVYIGQYEVRLELTNFTQSAQTIVKD